MPFWQRRFNSDATVIGRAAQDQLAALHRDRRRGARIPRRRVRPVVRHVAADRHAANRDARRQSTRRPRQPLAQPGCAAGAGLSREQARAELDATITQMRATWASQNRYIDHRAAAFPLDNAPDGGISVLRPYC